MPCKALHDLMPAYFLGLITALFPPSSIQHSQYNDIGFISDPWVGQDCSLLGACAPAAWNILPFYPHILTWFTPLSIQVLCLNVTSEEIFPTLLYQIVLSLFSNPLSYLICIVFVTTWNNCVLYLYNILYSFCCCVMTPWGQGICLVYLCILCRWNSAWCSVGFSEIFVMWLRSGFCV